MLSIKNVHYEYADGTKALMGVNLDIEPGERICILGGNGSGKSTLFLCINGVFRPTSGEIRLDGRAVRYDKKGLIEIRKRVGFVFQDPEIQLFCLNVYQEVAFGPTNLGYAQEEIKRRTEESMAMTDVERFRDKPPHFLSYGQKKRVSIASILSMDPRVILFDEPTSALDPFHSKKIMDCINALNEKGITILLSTHDMDLALSFADRIVVMKDGRILAFDEPEVIFADRDLIERAELYLPKVYHIYEILIEKGVIQGGGKTPRTVEELECALENR